MMSSNEASDLSCGHRLGPTEMDLSQNEQTNGNLELDDDCEVISDGDNNKMSDSGDDSDGTEVDEEEEEEEEDEDGDEESEEGENSDESDAEAAEPITGGTTTISAPRSPNNQPTCYICLNEFEGQDMGSPDSCENIHHFCLECIEEWSKQVNTCPVDRKSFSLILVKRDINGDVIMKVPVAKTSVLEIETMDDDLTYCEICGRCDREDRLLLCDGCDFGYHCECLTPPIDEIPIDEWFCPECYDRMFGGDALQETYRRQSTTRRAIARTGAFEIVRNRILARRTTEPGRSLASAASTSTPRRTLTRTTTRKRKTTKRRKTRKTTKKSTKNASGSKKSKRKKTKKRRKSKRSRKSKLSTQRLPASAAVRNRLASILGISCKPKASHGLPSVKKSKSITVADIRASAGIGNLSMFGHEHDLYEPRSYGEDFDFETSVSGYGGVGGLIARPRSHFSHSISKSIKAPVLVASHSSDDLLAEIMTSMEILHSSTSDLTIARDGRIQLKADTKYIQKCPDSNSHASSSSSNTSSPANSNGGSSNNGNSNNGYLKHVGYSEQSAAAASSHTSEGDISLVKPSPVVSLLDERPDFELYSDIESVGDNKEEAEETSGKKCTLAPSNANCDTKPVTSEKADNGSISVGETRLTDTAASATKDGEGGDDEDDDDKFELPKRNKPADGSSKDTKRRPSIRDLFGGDSDDEEVDDELKQLVAQQGSINVHYPIKMPIVLKTNFINDDKGQGGDEVSISKRWIPIYPEVEKNKSSGPKWKAVGWTENDDAKTTNKRSRLDDSQGGSSTDGGNTAAGESSARRVKVNNGLKVEKKDIKGVIVERRFGFSRTVELATSGSSTTTTASASVTASSIVVKAAVAASVEPRSSSSADVVVATHTSPIEPDSGGDNLTAVDGEVPAANVEKKVRVCKHGKVIKKEKTKETATVAVETVSRKRSQSAEPVEADKKPPKVLSPTEEHDNRNDSTVPQVKRSRLSADEPVERADDVNWKKLSSSSKMRNYRDGKYRDSDLIYKERPLRSSGDGKHQRSMTSHREEERESKSDYRSEREARNRHDDSMRKVEKSSSRSHNRTSSKKRSESPGSREVLASTWRRPSPEESKRSSKSHKHHKEDREEDRGHSSSHHRHRHHRHHHHRHHHHSSSKSDRSEKSNGGSANIAKAEEFKPTKSSSTYQAYPVIKSFDSKQIYSDGDNIIINVNFKKEETITDNSESQVASSKFTTTIERSSNKSESVERKHSTASSANNSHKENMDILSPQSTDNYANAHLQSDSNSVTSPLSSEDYGRNSNANGGGNSSSSSNSITNNNGTPSTSDHLKKILSEELNFLPRILQSTADSVGFGSQTPSDHFLGDSFMPTPTQDESHSPINGTSASENVGDGKLTSSIHSTSPAEEEENDDFYDPELPLQSPDRDSIKSPSKEKHVFESVSLGKESSNKKCDKVLPAIPSTSSSFSSSVAAATATLASLNNINISQLIQMAQTIGNKNSKANLQQKDPFSAKNPETKARDAVDSVDMDANSSSPLSSPLNLPSASSNRASNSKGTWDQLVKVTAAKQNSIVSKKQNVKFNINVQPMSTDDMDVKDKYLIKLNRQERVVEELKISLKPHFKKNAITKDEYKEILRKAVPKICHSKTGEINPSKIQMMVEQYIKRLKYLRKKN